MGRGEPRRRRGGRRAAGVALRYHESSKLTRGRRRIRSYGIDWEAAWRRPKRYELSERLLLDPPANDIIGANALALLSPPPEAAEDPDIGGANMLPSILYHGYGVTGSRSHKSAIYRLRAAPSAGAVYPAEVYLATGGFEGLPAGLYHYSPEDFALSLVRGGDPRGRLAAAFQGPGGEGRFYFIFTSMFWRCEERFGKTAYRYCLLDCGHVIGNFLTVLEGLGCRVSIRGGFADRLLSELLGLSEDAEQAVVVLQAGEAGCGALAGAESMPAQVAAGDWRPHPPPSRRRSVCRAVHNAGSLASDSISADAEPEAGDGAAKDGEGACGRRLCISEQLLTRLEGLDLGEVIAARRTQREFSGRPLAGAELASLLAACAVPYAADWLVSPVNRKGIDYFEQADLFVAAAAVEGLEPEVYRWSPPGGGLGSIGVPALREKLKEVCMDQKTAGEAAAVIFIAPRLDRYLARFGDRGYRYAGLHAGLLGERIYLTATALGLGVTGIAGLDDDLANMLCAADGRDSAVIYALAVGNPREKDPVQ